MDRHAAVIADATAALNRLLDAGVITSLSTNFTGQGGVFLGVPEVTVTIPDTADLADALEMIDQAIRHLGPTVVTWERDPQEDEP
jgi:hypothetical protein